MNGDNLKHVNAGQPFLPNAEAHNAFIDTTIAFRRMQSEGGRGFMPATAQSTIIKVRNDSGTDLERFHILQLDQPLFAAAADIVRNEISFSGGAITAGHFFRFGVALEPILSLRMGRCVVSGVTVAKIMPAPGSLGVSAGQWARPEADETILVADSYGGAEVLWAAGGAEEQFAVINIGPRQRRGAVRGRLTEELARGGVAEFEVYTVSASGGEGAATGELLSIVDGKHLADSASPLEVGVRVFGDWYGDVLMLEGYDCDLETT